MTPDNQRRPKQWVLLAYDVRDPKRLGKIARIAESYGERLQYSLFRCQLSQRQLERMNWELAQVAESEDDLLIAPLCARCAGQIGERDKTSGREWAVEEPAYRIL